MTISLRFDEDPSLEGLRVGLVEVRGYRSPSPVDPRFGAEAAAFAAKGEAAIRPERKAAVRSMLRYGSYRPAGRAKPSSEYLLAAALEGGFPSVSYAVDAANLVSLRTGYPISILDLAKAGSDFLLRRGREGESYVFNAGGQVIELRDLLCVCRAQGGAYVPTANPVRDSMATKIFGEATDLAAFIYAPAGPEGRALEKSCIELATFFGEVAESTSWRAVGRG